MNQPLVSVIIPNYNYGRFLSETIKSVLSQTYRSIEIIVVDDGSTDDSVQVLESFGDKIKFFCQKNEGVSKARNKGFSESRGEFIAFLDSDDLWLPEKIEKQLNAFLLQNDVGLVHCGFVDFNNDGQLLDEHLDGMRGWVATEMLRYRRSVILGGGSAVVVKRAAFEAVGGFDPNVSPAEDWEFYYQVAKRYKVEFVPEVLMKYRIHGSNSHLNIKRMEKAILGAYDKVFDQQDAELQTIRNSCYGKIHSVLAGSYFRAGHYGNFLRHSLKSIWLSPQTAVQYLGFPVRWMQRRSDQTNSSSR